MDERGRLSRRGLLVAGGLLLAGPGCSERAKAPATPSRATTPSGPAGSSPATSTGPSPTPSSPPVTETTPPEALPELRSWHPNPGDVEPGIKANAVRTLETIGTWQHRAGTVEGARRRLAMAGLDPRAAAQAVALLSRTASAAVVHVIDAQYGGLLADSASVLVPLREWRQEANGRVSRGGTTVDVRLQKTRSGWRVVALHPARPGPPRSPVSRLARAVLASRRIDLPPAARADLMSGQVHPSVLEAILRLARTYRIGVTVVRSGHPLHVFGTDRLSDHPQGRAFDTFRINGRLVVDPATPRSLVTGYMTAAADAGSYNVGGPYRPSGAGSQFFSDATHHDHVHAGFAA